jgi:predicted nucleic acid-binding protein
MKHIALQDANILIDLINTGLFDHCLLLRYQFTTTDIILNELHLHQVELIQPFIISGKFTIIEIGQHELLDIQILAGESTNLSVQDLSALYYAQKMNALLLTGDKRLRNLALEKGIIVCGVLWILDQLVDSAHLTKQQACSFLQKLIIKNKRLPATECEERIKSWCEE